MKLIFKAVGVLDVVFGMLFLIIAGVSALYIPGQMDRFEAEPEDLYGVIFFAVLGTVIGLTLIRVGLQSFRQEPAKKSSHPVLFAACILTAVLLSAFVMLDPFGPAYDPGSYGLRVMLVPAVTCVVPLLISKSKREEFRETQS